MTHTDDDFAWEDLDLNWSAPAGATYTEPPATCEACPFGGCRGCEAEVARRANGEAK